MIGTWPHAVGLLRWGLCPRWSSTCVRNWKVQEETAHHLWAPLDSNAWSVPWCAFLILATYGPVWGFRTDCRDVDDCPEDVGRKETEYFEAEACRVSGGSIEDGAPCEDRDVTERGSLTEREAGSRKGTEYFELELHTIPAGAGEGQIPLQEPAVRQLERQEPIEVRRSRFRRYCLSCVCCRAGDVQDNDRDFGESHAQSSVSNYATPNATPNATGHQSGLLDDAEAKDAMLLNYRALNDKLDAALLQLQSKTLSARSRQAQHSSEFPICQCFRHRWADVHARLSVPHVHDTPSLFSFPLLLELSIFVGKCIWNHWFLGVNWNDLVHGI